MSNLLSSVKSVLSTPIFGGKKVEKLDITQRALLAVKEEIKELEEFNALLANAENILEREAQISRDNDVLLDKAAKALEMARAKNFQAQLSHEEKIKATVKIRMAEAEKAKALIALVNNK